MQHLLKENSKERKLPFKRDICEFRSRTRGNLKQHVAAHSDERPFKCDICDYRARTRGNLADHVATHSDECPFKCDVCDYRTRTRGNLKRHVAAHSDERPFKCDICDFRTKFRSNLKKHVLTHSDERPFKCDICDYRARTCGTLKTHVVSHSDERPFKCNICDYRARTRSNLKQHVLAHSDERPFKCDICDYRTKFWSNLKQHVLTHSDQRPFKCDICDYRTKFRSSLKRHVLTHSDERPFKCGICEYRARKAEDLKNHVATHRDERPFKCPFCDFAAKIKHALRAHISRLHSSKYVIERKIKKTVATKSKRKNKYDQSKLTRKCRFCRNAFNRRESLISHENYCRKFKGERFSMKDNAEKPNQGNVEANSSDSNKVQSESRSTGVADFVLPLKLKSVDKRESSQPKRIVSNIIHDSLNESDQSNEVEIHSESDPDEPRNTRESNPSHSQRIGSNLNQGISLNSRPSKRKFNTICPTITSEEIKKEPEPVSSANFSSEFDINCVKLENEAATPLSANEAIYGPESEASRLESSVKWEEPIDHLKNEFGFHNNDAVDQDARFINKPCSIILTKLEDSGNYLGCYYVRMKEPPYVYEVVKVNLNAVI